MATTKGADGVASEVSKMTVSNESTTTNTTNSTSSSAILGGIPLVIGTTAPPTVDRSPHRAVHEIRLSGLSHNYNCVEAAANRQRCSVIVVVKADGYGHGAVATALHLADSAGADAFAVATLEEAITLRKAFERTSPGGAKNLSTVPATNEPGKGLPTDASNKVCHLRRSAHIRILVLGPPVNFPKCFADYHWHGIEMMCSGPEVAKALLAWIHNAEERKRALVEKSAQEAKTEALNSVPTSRDETPARVAANGGTEDTDGTLVTRKASVTLSNVSGQELANEVRAILMKQEREKEMQSKMHNSSSQTNSGRNTPGSTGQGKGTTMSPSPSVAASNSSKNLVGMFGGIEAAASTSRNREKVARARDVFVERSGDDSSTASTSLTTTSGIGLSRANRKIRWHALVDSGMGRLGFRTEPVSPHANGRRDSVAILKELVDAEMNGAPIEFSGMCTHMAEATAGSNYTQSQIEKFKSLLKRVRDAGISIPTISTDNSAALLTTTLNHFDPDELLRQSDVNTRGFVRTGGAIYGQRPSFPQLKAVSTLKAAVRHVAVLKKGESVGYDRAYVAEHDVRIATLTIGFADGYPRELGNKNGSVVIRGAVFPVAGNVCMDMLMVELGPAKDMDGIGAEVAVGDIAILWGPGENEDGFGLVKLQDIAATLKTTQSALTCGLDQARVLRQLT